MKTYLPAKFVAERDMERCIRCKVCVNQCSLETHYHEVEDDAVRSREGTCVGCHRCAMFCPTKAITIKKAPMDYRENYNWRPEVIEDIIKRAETGGVLVLLGLTLEGNLHHRASFVGTGMHGGVIYLRGNVEDYQLGREVGRGELDAGDRQVLGGLLAEYGAHFGRDVSGLAGDKFIKLFPKYLRPYGRLYAY